MNHPRPVSGALSRQTWSNFFMPSRISSGVENSDPCHSICSKVLLQFPWFNKYQMQADEFFRRLRFFLQRVRDLPTVRSAVEIRNRAWLDKRLTELLREYKVALALTDISWMPRPLLERKGGHKRRQPSAVAGTFRTSGRASLIFKCHYTPVRTHGLR